LKIGEVLSRFIPHDDERVPLDPWDRLEEGDALRAEVDCPLSSL
jgi:hypothetical protein